MRFWRAANRLVQSSVAIAVLLAAANSVEAQQTAVRLVGVVRDSAAGTALRDAVITATVRDSVRTARSDSAGRFSIVLPTGQITLNARRLGYRSASRRIDAVPIDTVSIVLVPLPQALAETRVTANAMGIRGVVGADGTLSPLARATVRVLGKDSASTDSSGRFYIPISKSGPYVVRISAGDYRDRIVSVEIDDGKPVDLFVLLDRATAGARISEMALAEFDKRQHWLGQRGALIPSEQLTRYRGSVIDAILGAPSFVRKGLRIGSSVCVFINGQPKPGLPLDAFRVEEIAAIEVYTAKGDDTNSLVAAWPLGAHCTDTGIRSAERGPSLVSFVAIWTK